MQTPYTRPDWSVTERRYRLVIDNLKEVVFQTDERGVWTFLNPAWTELTGFPVQESVGRTFTDFVHPEDRARGMELLEAMAAGIPVVATPVGAIPDVLANGTHGYLVPPRDGKAIAEALAMMAGDREQLINEDQLARVRVLRVHGARLFQRLAKLLLSFVQLRPETLCFCRHRHSIRTIAAE